MGSAHMRNPEPTAGHDPSRKAKMVSRQMVQGTGPQANNAS